MAKVDRFDGERVREEREGAKGERGGDEVKSRVSKGSGPYNGNVDGWQVQKTRRVVLDTQIKTGMVVITMSQTLVDGC